MSKNVKKHCSVLNYLKEKDPKLFEAIESNCLNGIFHVRYGSSGLTFLRPNPELSAELQKKLSSNDGIEGDEAMKALVLLDYLPSLKDFDDRKNDIPNFHRKKLQVASYKDGKILLANGAEVTLDPDFDHRENFNIAVYLINKKLAPVGTDPATFENTKKPVKRGVKGGADYGSDKRALFEKVLKACASCGGKRDPALETLVSLLLWSKTKNTNIHRTVSSLLSHDTLATLAIVLQPYRNTSDECTYIPDAQFQVWKSVMGDNPSELFGYLPNPVAYYSKCMEEAAQEFAGAMQVIQKLQKDHLAGVSKISIATNLDTFYKALKADDKIQQLPDIRRKVLANRVLTLAEAELRTHSAVLRSHPALNFDDLRNLFTSCNLNRSVICESKLTANANIAYFYSVMHTVAKSQACFYLPGAMPGASGLAEVANSAVSAIDLNLDLALKPELDAEYAQQCEKTKELFARINDLAQNA